MKLRSFAMLAFILTPRLAYAAGGVGTGLSNAGNGGPSGVNSDANNGNTPGAPAGSIDASGTRSTDVPGTMGDSKQMKRREG